MTFKLGHPVITFGSINLLVWISSLIKRYSPFVISQEGVSFIFDLLLSWFIIPRSVYHLIPLGGAFIIHCFLVWWDRFVLDQQVHQFNHNLCSLLHILMDVYWCHVRWSSTVFWPRPGQDYSCSWMLFYSLVV